MKEKISKNVELTSVIKSYLESTMDIGDEIVMTNLAKELGNEKEDGKKTTHHKDTVTKELERADFLGETLINNFERTYKNGKDGIKKLVRIKKIEKSNEIKELWKSITKLNEKQDEIIKLLKKR